MGKADYKKRELMDNEQDALLEYKELVCAHNAGKKKKKSNYKKICKDDKLVRAKEDLDEKKEGFQVTEQHSRWCKKMLTRNYRRKNKKVEIEEEE